MNPNKRENLEKATLRAIYDERLHMIAVEILSDECIEMVDMFLAYGQLTAAKELLWNAVDECIGNESLPDAKAAAYYRTIDLPVGQVELIRQHRRVELIEAHAEEMWQAMGEKYMCVRCH